MSRWLVIVGLVLVLLGVLWPWLVKLGLGRLPGDLFVEKGEFRFYFPIATSLLLSLLLSLLWWFFRK